VSNWLVRSDLTARTLEFIALAEARLNRVVRKRQAAVDATLTATPASRAIALPSTFGEALNLWIVIDGQREAMTYRDPVLMESTTAQGRPEFWGIDGANVVFEQACDSAYVFALRHMAKYALSDASPTNTLLTDAPDVYLFATLCEAAPFLRDPELSASYEAKLTRAIGELNFKDGRSKSQQRLVTEPAAILRHSRGAGYDIARDA
jgi:hypothetical protein